MPNRTGGDADTMPASQSGERGDELGAPGDPGDNAGRAREPRATIPDIAPPAHAAAEPRYRLGAELGRGGMGRVVEAFDTQLGRSVALKEVLPKAGAAVDEQRFEREVQITARLEHPSIVPLYDSGRMPDGRPFYVMRKVSGRPLDQLIHRARDLGDRLALLPNLLAAIDAVGHAHHRGIVHRDLKPANILIGDNGETVVIDWGLAKVIGESDLRRVAKRADAAIAELAAPLLVPVPPDGGRDKPTVDAPSAARRAPGSSQDELETQAGSVFGTPGFMPPEQARGEGGGKHGDVYALGATLYQLLAGRPPIAGTSATEAIASTLTRKIMPIAQAAPAAPAELQAIVEQALAFDAADRYADAEQLAADVRRFTTGQLVAAHSYTTRERVARFARRHRAPLSVAALALAAVAVLAWIGVHRILVERDLATTAEQDARRQRDTAVELSHKLQERADALVIDRARRMIATDPTEALAIVKDIRPDSPRIADARGIAASAVARGVAWGLRADGAPRFLDMDRDGIRLAEVTDRGMLHVWDLDTHRVLYEHSYDPFAVTRWLGDGRLLLFGFAQRPPEALDIRSGRLEPVPMEPAHEGMLDDGGTRFAYLGVTGGAGLFDFGTRKLVRYADAGVKSIHIAPDGTWVVLETADAVTVVDPLTGASIFTTRGAVAVFAVERDRFAGIDDRTGTVAEIARDASGAWSRIDIALPDKIRPLMPVYRGGRLDVFTFENRAYVFDHGKLVNHFDAQPASAIARVGSDTLVMATGDGEIGLWNDTIHGTLRLPAALSNIRLAGRPDKLRLAVAGNGLVFVYDLAQILPGFMKKAGVFDVLFADGDTVLLWPDQNASFAWLDLATGKRTPIDDRLDMLTAPADIDPKDGRVLFLEALPGAPTATLAVVTRGKPKVETVVRGDSTLRGVLAPDGVLFAQGSDARVMFAEHGGTVRELAKVGGGVDLVQVVDRAHFAALGRTGELVRGAFAGGPLERVQIQTTDETFIRADRAGGVLIASGAQLRLWPAGGGAIRPVATLTRRISGLWAVESGTIVRLDDNSIAFVTPDAAVHDVIAASSQTIELGGDGSWLATPATDGEIEIVELPSLAHWKLPRFYDQTGQVVAAPMGRRLMIGSYGGYELYQLPAPPSDLTAWVEDRTDAFETADSTLGWPWQRP